MEKITTLRLEPPPHINDLAYVKASMERWARWCHGSFGGGISITGRLMQGIKANVCPGWLNDMQAGRAHSAWCPDCDGTGRVKMNETLRTRPSRCPVCDDNGQFAGRECFRCHGTRRITRVHAKINPASIHSTRHVGGQASTDACTVIDNLVSAWREYDATFWLGRVAVSEYHHNGTQEMKARRLKISLATYKRSLNSAHRQVGIVLAHFGL